MNTADHGCGATHATLDKLVDLLERDGALLDRHAEHLLSHIDERATSDRGQDGVSMGLRDD